ncbi:hypothetical protein CAOG_03154 [Capsaspora owczarzaki ATCC 30864]|uniref:DDRGK domain-containing protein 1 n=1 Tax=Capsaspora owczarzaki (strain ATCC 30864) TaxID=595528 RepID=A0A0D2UAU8_CAPO3|nr:hypothetical protein CAOG_03154 [Capsaspora owczarzaki ATCC 30864]KJE92136.1 hypothetical protein CAOG_003154 [Capsaspora owczarzaki ATCC 30864]|eukprot:XP_004363993.1 hypothetical protein CAOG_03154 [Capsaspora owczarzaki ATCC 30864]
MLIYVYTALAIAVAVLLYIVKQRQQAAKQDAPQQQQQQQQPEAQQAQQAQPGQAQGPGVVVGGRRAQRDGGDVRGRIPFPSNIGKKKLAKLQAKEERRQQNAFMEAQREDKKRRDAAIAEDQKRLDEEQRIKDEAEAQIEQARLAEIARKEEEEYQRMKAEFAVEEEGTDAVENAGNEENLLEKFVEYIKSKKVVYLEDLAAHFQLKTPDAINRLKAVEQMGALTGVLDDRGKYIYISRDELGAVAKFIRQHGRVSISELAAASNSLINLSA